MLKFATIIFLIVILSGCKRSQKGEYFQNKILENKRAEIEKVGEIKIEETENNLIGMLKLFEVYLKEKIILIGDHIFCDMKIYSINGKLIKKIGRKGEGPGEFKDVNGVALDHEYYYVSDGALRRISTFNKDGLFQKSIKVQTDIWFDTGEVIVRNNKIYMNSFETKYKVFWENHLTKQIAVLDTSGKILYHFGSYPEIYKKYKLMWTQPRFDLDEDDNTYISSSQTWQLAKYDLDGNLIKFFGVKGSNFIEIKESFRGNETIKELHDLGIKYSFTTELEYGGNFIYQQYSKINEKFIKSRSLSDRDSFLMVYTKDGEYIKSDIKLPGGGMLDVDDEGIIYIELSDEPGNRIIGKYKLKIVDEN